MKAVVTFVHEHDLQVSVLVFTGVSGVRPVGHGIEIVNANDVGIAQFMPGMLIKIELYN